MKKNYASLLVVCAMFFVLSGSASAQSIQDRYFKGVSYSMLDFYKGPVVSVDENSTTDFHVALNLIAMSYHQRFNVVEMNDNSSVSLDLPIIAGYGVTGFSFVVPLTVNYNLGNVSTYNSNNNKGFTVGAGVEYIYLEPRSDNNLKTGMGYNSWIQPVGNIGYRYWSKTNKAREINLKAGYAPSSGDFQDNTTGSPVKTVSDPSYSFRLSFIQYFNY